MQKLSRDWITEKCVDAEYKKYILLAWLQYVEKSFREVKLYPPLADLISHYQWTRTLLERKHELESLFPKKISGIDTNQFILRYEKLVSDEQLMNEIGQIIEFSIPKFETWLKEGKHIYEFLEKEIKMEMIGIVPMHLQEGYLFLRNAGSETKVYSYSVKLFEEAGSPYRALQTVFVSSFTGSFVTYDSIKLNLLRSFPALPNPAVYAAESALRIPIDETLLPIAKRMMLRSIASAEKRA